MGNEAKVQANADVYTAENEVMLKLHRQLEMRLKRQRESIVDTEMQLAALRKQLGLK